MFSEKLKRAIEDSGINQKMLSKKSGVSQGSISHYIAGTSIPNDESIEKLETVLGPLRDSEDLPREDKTEQTSSVRIVAKAMNTTPDVIRAGARQGIFPWAYAVKREKRWVYLINLPKFESVEGIKVS